MGPRLLCYTTECITVLLYTSVCMLYKRQMNVCCGGLFHQVIKSGRHLLDIYGRGNESLIYCPDEKRRGPELRSCLFSGGRAGQHFFNAHISLLVQLRKDLLAVILP